jgi:hypothetical protein
MLTDKPAYAPNEHRYNARSQNASQGHNPRQPWNRRPTAYQTYPQLKRLKLPASFSQSRLKKITVNKTLRTLRNYHKKPSQLSQRPIAAIYAIKSFLLTTLSTRISKATTPTKTKNLKEKVLLPHPRRSNPARSRPLTNMKDSQDTPFDHGDMLRPVSSYMTPTASQYDYRPV